MFKSKEENELLKKAKQQGNSQIRSLTLEEQLDQFADIIIDIYLETENENNTKQFDSET